MFRKKATAEKSTPVAKSKAPPKGQLKGKSKAGDEIAEVIDLSASLVRALHNPLKTAAAPTKTRPDAEIRTALTNIEATFYAIDAIRELLVEACQLVLKAKDIDDLAGRSLLAEQYDEMRERLNGIIAALDPEADALIGPTAKPLQVTLNASTYMVQTCRLDISETGLNLTPPAMAFESLSEIAAKLGELDGAVSKVDRASQFYMQDAQFLIRKLENSA